MGATCTCAQRIVNDDDFPIEQTNTKQADDVKDQTDDQNEASLNNNHVQKQIRFITDQAAEPDNERDPIQLSSYEWEDNKPNEDYAKPLSFEEEQNLESNLKENIARALKKHSQLTLRITMSSNYKKIPKQDQPYVLLETGNVYIGQWANGKPFGIGRIYFKDGNLYDGQVADGLPDGEGRKIFIDGSVYFGQMKQGIMDGKGRVLKRNKFCYEGMWVNGKPHGRGMEEWPNGTSYQGDYVEGRKEGSGLFRWGIDLVQQQQGADAIQEQYDGEFLDNVFNGQGKYEWKDGRVYDGQWKMGKMSGQGQFIWSDQRKYTGGYLEDLKCGMGTFEWPDGKTLSGYWKLGRLDGEATLLIKGKSYQGLWENGKRVKWLKDEQQSQVLSKVISVKHEDIGVEAHDDDIDNDLQLLMNKQIKQDQEDVPQVQGERKQEIGQEKRFSQVVEEEKVEKKREIPIESEKGEVNVGQDENFDFEDEQIE